MLEVRHLSVEFPVKRGTVAAVSDVSFTLEEGEIVGIVGESGSGKSTLLLALLQLIPYPGRITGGEIVYRGRNLLELPGGKMRKIRGKEIAMVFQDPLSTLNPVFKVGEQIRESLRVHNIVPGSRWGLFGGRSRKALEKERVEAIMKEVGIPSARMNYNSYPHQFSGGMRQRVLIAIALAGGPSLLLADEPTTALDVTIQAQILALMEKVNRERGTSIILVTHDLGVAAEFCHKIIVMYAGRIMEMGSTEEIIRNPEHPYTRALLQSIPRLSEAREKLHPIPGDVPDLTNLPGGCVFHPRCEIAQDECTERDIPLFEVSPGHFSRCLLHADQGGLPIAPVGEQAESFGGSISE